MHTAFVKIQHRFFQFFRIDPVVGRTGVFLFFGSDVSSRFNARYVGDVRAEKQPVRPLFFAQAGCQTAFHHFIRQTVVLFGGSIAPINAFRFANGSPFINPGEQFFVVC